MSLRQFVRSRTTGGFRDAIRNIRVEREIQRKHFRALARMRKMQMRPPYRIQFGCGTNAKPGWINIDLLHRDADLREPLPFPDNSAVQIYSEHFFEHLAYPDQVSRLLKESLRVLQRGGLFGIAVPDTVWPLESYANKSEEYFNYSYGQGFLPQWCHTRMDVINQHFRGFGAEGGFGSHRYAYDIETLSYALQQAGFVRIIPRSYDPSLDSELRKRGTLYVDAYKP